MSTRSPSPTRTLFLASSLVALVGCSSSGSSSGATSSGGGSSGATSTCKTYDPCTMVAEADVTAAIGGSVAAGTTTDTSSSAVEVKQCTWASSATPASRRASLLVRCYNGGDNDPAGVRTTLTGLYKNVTDVSGVGDSAIWGSGVIGSSATTIDGQLDVFVGKTLYFIVDVGKMPDDPSALAAAKQIGQAVVPKL